MGQNNSKQSTAIRSKIAGIILSSLILLSASGLIFVGKIPLNTLPMFYLIFMGAIFFVGIGLFFKNKACWYLAVIALIFFVVVLFNGVSEYNQKHPEKAHSLIYEVLIGLPFIVSLLLLFSDRPGKWRERNLVKRGYKKQETSLDLQNEKLDMILSTGLNVEADINDYNYKSEDVNQERHKKTKKCPKCAEEIKLEALICQFCRYEFDENDVQKTIQELEDRKEEVRKNLEAEIKRKEESLQVQKTLKMKKVDRIKMNMQYALCALMGVIFFLIGGFMSIVLINEARKGDFGGMLVFGFFLFFFILAFILMYRKAKKIKSDLANAIKEIEELTVALPK